MPLLPGKAKVGYNISELVDSGHPRKQAIAIALKKAGLSKPKKKEVHSVGKKVLLREKALHGNVNNLVLCEVLAENEDGTMRCKCQGKRDVVTVHASQVIKAESVMGTQQGPGMQPLISRQPPSHNSLGSLLRGR